MYILALRQCLSFFFTFTFLHVLHLYFSQMLAIASVNIPFPVMCSDLHNGCPTVGRLLWLTCLPLKNQCCQSIILSCLLSRKKRSCISAFQWSNSSNSDCVWIFEFKAFGIGWIDNHGQTMEHEKEQSLTFYLDALTGVITSSSLLTFSLHNSSSGNWPSK